MGRNTCPPAPRVYQTKVKNAQEAHEAIRPAGHPFDFPESLRGRLSPDEFKLYDLVWKRTIASQMADARGHRVTVTHRGRRGASSRPAGKTIEFPGYLRAYVEGSDDPEADLADRDVVLPAVAVGETLRCLALQPKSHTTQPPNRYSEASLTRALEEMGIGRPSTYASIIDTILARDYVFKLKRGNVLVPTWTAFAVSQLLEAHLPDLVDYQFTAEMEDELDAISRGEMNHLDYLRTLLFRQRAPGAEAIAGEQDQRRSTRATSAASRWASRPAKASPRPRFSSASAATGRSWNKANAARACPRHAARRTDPAGGAGFARQGRPERRAAGHLSRHGQAGVRQDRPLRSLCAAGHGRRRREAAKRLAAVRAWSPNT